MLLRQALRRLPAIGFRHRSSLLRLRHGEPAAAEREPGALFDQAFQFEFEQQFQRGIGCHARVRYEDVEVLGAGS